jgi:molecular chaperone DnaK
MTAPSVDEAVCLGAAIRAALEADSRMLNSVQRSALENKSLTDVTNRHYGTLTINVEDGRLINAIILKKDTPLPCSATETFYTIVEGQTEVECKITESSWEERDADLVQLKATATLHLPPNRPAEREVRVTYSYDINQVIQCEFLDVESGRKEVVELNLEKESDKANDFQIDDFVID